MANRRGVDATTDGLLFVYSATSVTSITPSRGPTSGGTRIVLAGLGIDFHSLLCHIEGVSVPIASFLSPRQVECVTPPHPRGIATVQVRKLPIFLGIPSQPSVAFSVHPHTVLRT